MHEDMGKIASIVSKSNLCAQSHHHSTHIVGGLLALEMQILSLHTTRTVKACWLMEIAKAGCCHYLESSWKDGCCIGVVMMDVIDLSTLLKSQPSWSPSIVRRLNIIVTSRVKMCTACPKSCIRLTHWWH